MDYFLFDFSGVQFHYTMSHKKFVSCQLNYTTTVGIMIAETKISLWLYHLLLCGGVNTACEISNSNKLQEAYSN